MARLTKPKKRKYPKKPKATASADTMQNYLDKVDQIDKDYKKDLSDYDKEKKRRETLRKKVVNTKR